MVRISNGFQLSLERDNVFYDYYGVKPRGETGTANASNGPVALLTDEECWKRLPATTSGGGQPLPSWAKAVAVQLPRTAAAMLELDHAQRTKSPIDPVLRAKMRWVIAHANRCALLRSLRPGRPQARRRRRRGCEGSDWRPVGAGPRATATRSNSPGLLTVSAPDDQRRAVRTAPQAVRRQASRGDGLARGVWQLSGPRSCSA